MTDIRRTVDELRFYLESTEAEMSDSIREAAREYADACRQANQRLRRCGDFLNRNLRSEAIHLAEGEPDLLELIATLEFPGRYKWDEVVGLYSLPVGEPLLMEVAEALNEAYALQEPVKKLLDKHRLLALSHAPLKQRLAVLWELVAQDGTLGTWESDTCEMERARLAEIEAAGREAGKQLDTRTLQALVEEVDSGKWIERVPSQTKKLIMQRWREVTATVARAELEELATALEAAFHDSDLMLVQALKEQWDQSEPIARLDDYDPLIARVGPIFRWMQQQEVEQETLRKSDRALGELARAIDNRSTPRDELEQLSRRAVRLGPELPEPLADRLRTRLALIDRHRRNRRLLIAGGCSLAIVALGVCVAFLAQRWMHLAESQRAAESVVAMANAGRRVDARKFVNEHGDMFASTAWSEAIHKLEQAEEQESKRVADFQNLIGTVTKTSFYEEARSKLSEAGRIATTDAEKSRLTELEANWDKRHSDELTGKKADNQKRLDVINANFARAETMIALPKLPAELQPLFLQVSQQISDLQNSVGDPNSEFGQKIDPLKNQLKNLEHTAELANEKVKMMEAIKSQSTIRPTAADSGTQVDQYIALLTNFASTFPNDSRTADFKQSAEEAAIYRGVCEWQTLAGRWTGLVPTDLEEARKRKGECDEFIKKHKECPACSLLDRYSRFLSAIVHRYEGEGGNKAEGLIAKLHELYAGPLMQNVHVIWDSEGNAYYVKSEADFRGKPVATIHYFSDFQGKIANKTIQVGDLKSARSEPAAQNRLSESAIRTLNGLTVANWEPSMKQICQAVLETRDLDAFLQYALLRYTVEYASAGSQPLETELQKSLEFLADPQLDLSVRWMLPNDAAAKAARSRAGQLVAKLIQFESAWSRAEESHRHFAQELFTHCVFVGALERGQNGEWVCASCWKPDGNYDLIVAVSATGQAPPSWEVIGKAKNRQLELTSREGNSGLREGRLVLARGTASSDSVAGTGSSAQSETKK